MNKNNKKRISINEAVEGMELAEDVINNNGLILIPKKTVLTQTHIYKLYLYQILSILIIDDKPTTNLDIAITLTKDTKEFLEFKENYVETTNGVQEQLNLIGKGQHTKIDDLFSITNTFINSIGSKNKLFKYLSNLQIYDDYTFSHSLNVSMLCNIFGQWLNYKNKDLENITVAGLLHDIGKINIDLNILNKPGKLTAGEYEIIKKHPLLGFNIVKDLDIPYEIKMGILMHHEKYDGSGYPFGFKNEQLHAFSKIIEIVDIYDAMTSERSYHNALCPFKVIQMFEKNTYGLLDTRFLKIFLENIAYNYLGAYVRLSNDQLGKIVFINGNHPSSPIVAVNDTMIDLYQNESINIIEIM